MQSGKIVVQNLYKVFGQQPQEAIDLLKQGWSKERILAERGAVIGVSDVSFSVEEGEIFVLMGLSGSGKSTLIRLINRLIEPTAGDVFIDGQNVAKLPKAQLIDLRRRDMSMVFQSFALMPSRTVLDNAAFGLEVAGKSKKERERRAMEVLEQVGLAPFAQKYPHELSGGMQQRVGLARALAVDPSMIIMDEAFSALDPLKRREMQDVLLQLQKTHRRTIIFVSHDIEEAMRIGTRIGIMEGGKLVQVGTPQELIEKPANDYVRNFFDTVDTSRYLTAGQLKADSVPLYVHNGKAPDAQQVCQELQALDKHYAFIVDEDNKFRGSISLEKIALLVEEGQTRSLEPELLKHIVPVPEDLPLEQVIERLVDNEGPIPVVDQDGHYCGAISKGRLLSRLQGE
ncbi:glycine betaine/L-proline ABC transporter ATP-binding protein [Pseudomonas sp. No.21]|uniref:Quaternary amine transport ATP-binding protein n=1 Tax=Pseudomonas tohonis TaxID=2725477 RepID=A0A6J4E1I3_9PSED|nr:MULTISPECIES: glycine betaine/L-proline ABC transporter ATP-binding protein [Pseudomonas]MDW3710950.1 glycine betaine/L-proline ABC transporter ATP-binding protein [Pseudomonas sp. 2023EL-01195]PZE15090.1 glycine betaine/L-proline ABC transporter ATP-binding protein [Pseudomonas sp. 57B-090624]BBP80838.1 proline/glycine betaine ABC transporter ATP-binding protein [Pseudomonas sp. Pc102]BCG22421.1 proline/glycine betaine ABC transporter ATP-binding protein [Pseudomonas tohonis]GJN47350.1 pro